MMEHDYSMPTTHFVVKFVSKDEKPDEEYFYPHIEDARHHFDLFRDDDSGLYTKVELITWPEGSSMEVLDTIQFLGAN